MSSSIDFEHVMNALSVFGSAPILVKDYVKSQKHYWYEACYIPSAADRDTVERVVLRFVQLQDDDLNEGLVFRQFVPFESLGINAKSGIPIAREFRTFFLDGTPLYSTAYWPDVSYTDEIPGLFTEIAHTIKSRFFTMDIAKKSDGKWMIVELGDGQ